MYVLSASGFAYATLDKGHSLSKSDHLESAIGAQAMIQRTGISGVFLI